jgi:hypothetical protein
MIEINPERIKEIAEQAKLNPNRLSTVDPGKIEGHIQNLQLQHDTLDKQIQEAVANYVSDEVVNSLKKHKLYLKDEIEIYTSKLNGTYVEPVEETSIDPDLQEEGN